MVNVGNMYGKGKNNPGTHLRDAAYSVSKEKPLRGSVYTKKYPVPRAQDIDVRSEDWEGNFAWEDAYLVQLTCRSSCVPFWPSDLSLFPPPPAYALPLWTTIPELTTGRLYLGCGLNLKETYKEIHILIYFIYTTIQRF